MSEEMRYISTRGKAEKKRFSEILLDGLADDGGLYVPEYFPQVSPQDLDAMRSMPYPELAFEIIKRFCEDTPQDIPHQALKRIVEHTYRPEVFGYVRVGQNPADITPTLKLDDNLHLLCLSNGPTLAFKDIAMQFLGNIFEYVLAREGRVLNILGATSGDTGSAAEYAMRGKKNINVFMLTPYGRMTPFQTAQMYSLQDANIFNVAINGDFDACQALVKLALGYEYRQDGVCKQFRTEYNLSTVNSINWGRIVAQVVYYFKGYLAVTQNNSQRVRFTVPSGNFGNAYAGYVAKRMGLPIDKIVVATNENDTLHQFFSKHYTPAYVKYFQFSGTEATSSPSMDILRASNFERLYFDLQNRNIDVIQEQKLFQNVGLPEVQEVGEIDSYADTFGKDLDEELLAIFASGCSTHQDRIHTIQQIYQQYSVVIDPHTADGMKVALDNRQSDVPMLVLETALPYKFEATITAAGVPVPERPTGLQGLEAKPQNYERIEISANECRMYQDRAKNAVEAYIANILDAQARPLLTSSSS